MSRRLRLSPEKHPDGAGPTFEGSEQRTSKGHPLVTETFSGELEFPAGLSRRRKAEVCKAVDKRCDLDLDFINDEDAEKFHLPPGTRAVLQKCVHQGEYGQMVPVASAEEAMREATSFCTCVGKARTAGPRQKCARHRGAP